MNFIADYTLTHGLSAPDTKWPYMPFTYNTYIYSGIYDGDMRNGPGVQQDTNSHLGAHAQGFVRINANDFLDFMIILSGSACGKSILFNTGITSIPCSIAV